jgi:uncharacterized protein with PIN domain
MEVAFRQSSSEIRARVGNAAKRCSQCGQPALVMSRRHVSPPRLGTPLVTEYYDCDFCDARYQYSPADDRWRPIYQ